MFEGPIIPVTFRIGMPILIGNVFNLLFTIVDTLFISMIDSNSTAILSGTGLVFPLFFFFLAIATGISVGIGALVARAIGEDNTSTLTSAADSGLALSISLAGISLIAGLFLGPHILSTLAGSELSQAALKAGERYFIALLPGLCLLLVWQTILGILQGEGLTRYIAISVIVSTLVNLILDPIFIFSLEMGEFGAGIATSLSIFISFIVTLLICQRKKLSAPISAKIWRANTALIKKIVNIGLPQSIGMLGMSVAFLLLNNLVSSINEAAMNAWTLVGRTDQMLLIPGFALSGATITMVGQNFGRKNFKRLKKIFHTNIITGLVTVTIIAGVYNLIAMPLFSLFTDVEEVLKGAVQQVRIISFTTASVSALFVIISTFQSTGKPLPALFITLMRIGAIAVPVAFILAKIVGLGMLGVYIGIVSGNLLILPIAWIWCSKHIDKLNYNSVN